MPHITVKIIDILNFFLFVILLLDSDHNIVYDTNAKVRVDNIKGS